MTTIATYDHEKQGLDILATITKDTSLAIGAKYNTIDNKHMLFGYNVYAIDLPNVSLLETYETPKEAEYMREIIFNKLIQGQGMIIL